MQKIFDNFEGPVVKIGNKCYFYIGETTKQVNTDPSEITGVYDDCYECANDYESSSSSEEYSLSSQSESSSSSELYSESSQSESSSSSELYSESSSSSENDYVKLVDGNSNVLVDGNGNVLVTGD